MRTGDDNMKVLVDKLPDGCADCIFCKRLQLSERWKDSCECRLLDCDVSEYNLYNNRSQNCILAESNTEIE